MRPLLSELRPGLQRNRVRVGISLGALVLAGIQLVWAVFDTITLILLLAALLPWLGPLVKSVELPGGVKFELRQLKDLEERAVQAGLLPHLEVQPSEVEFAFQRIANQDPNLALAGLRIEIERRLATLAERNDIPVRGRGVGLLLRSLSERGLIGQAERSVLADLIGLLNQAVHGVRVDREAAEWAMDVGLRLLQALDRHAGRSDGDSSAV